MFYDCGSIDDCVYVFDSEDETCELINRGRLAISGLNAKKFENKGIFHKAKLKMLYGFKGDDISSVLQLCSYWVNFTDYNAYKIRLYFRLTNMLNDYVGYSSDKYEVQELHDFCYNYYMLFLVVEPVYSDMIGGMFESYPSFKLLSISEERFFGIPVPLQMFYYIVRLAKMHNFIEMNRALAGLLYENIAVRSRNGYYKRKNEFDENDLSWSV